MRNSVPCHNEYLLLSQTEFHAAATKIQDIQGNFFKKIEFRMQIKVLNVGFSRYHYFLEYVKQYSF